VEEAMEAYLVVLAAVAVLVAAGAVLAVAAPPEDGNHIIEIKVTSWTPNSESCLYKIRQGST
jgi:ABC-type glycerol-3-phosphate transport system substrate-binding protein